MSLEISSDDLKHLLLQQPIREEEEVDSNNDSIFDGIQKK